jgi:membrane protease YdiL (CAAX protease family)
MLSLWRRLPVVVRAVFTGLVVATMGTAPWAVLVKANSKHWSAVPWAVPLTVLYLWLRWQYVSGKGWPQSTAQTRRSNLRAYQVSEKVWGAAIIAGMLGVASLMLFLGVVTCLVRLPVETTDDLSRIPFLTVVFCLLMGSAVAGVVEEASFRGYMPGPIERRHGSVAILVTGTMFGLAHFTHPGVLILMPYYLALAAIFGALAYLTNSILPSMVLHAGVDVLGGMQMSAASRTEWLASRKPLIWETGAAAWFCISCVVFLIVGAAAVWAYATLANVARPRLSEYRRFGDV